MRVKRIMLEWYEKHGDDFVGECEITSLSVEQVTETLKFSAGDSLCDVYRVTEKIADTLKPYVNCEVDLSKFDYFVTFEAE
jgi:hypothetical protein